ncbi:acyl-CoA dehydrogenase [Marivirga tractuosa]|uniref:glutaryl-CoA dehydrogenase (ETF) n=1 Tax=Marivirga tractuosa (strain ATCC 23168 / DSM 4126 / NBRC 15989 / NCIMB 1408 / VKM B-1430 / H-43) TaxID=643867 RepID=E4TKL1_MARTH|nr:acyl-CoA dehydrogenase family protein [Marivirga tractuosa]ADR21177.1 acyl-CoA dehydrogenase domain-containing protein [Marivirga tractuosa DSM 4126]BDD14370.1 acyl-CoA dehydrogenase [Marivirga tractuosa]
MNNQSTDQFESPDFYALDGLLTEEHKLIRQSVRDFVKKEISPNIEEWAQNAHFPYEIVKKFGDVGAFGPTIPQEYGGGGLDYISYGLIMQEIERGDSGMRSTASVQGSLVMYPIYAFGNEAQRKKYLPKLASGEWLGSFGLTEPDHGSNPSGMTTNFKDKGDHYLLNGAKMWISNSPKCDVAVVWAKNEEGRIHGLIVERGMEGFTTPETHGKWSLRASTTGELVFDNVKVPKENLLEGKSGLGAPMKCLDSARFGIAWGAIGAAMDCYDSARRYSLERIQFGKPIASFQLTQKKLSEMLTEITKSQLLNYRLAQLMDEGKASTPQISMAKRNAVEIALNIAREARQIHGGMGITGDYPMMRHMANLESVVTYEGTHDIHLLILGKEITGIPAFE